jgi:hypothetical protein
MEFQEGANISAPGDIYSYVFGELLFLFLEKKVSLSG